MESSSSQIERNLRLIQQADPIFATGYTLVYDREVPCEFRNRNANPLLRGVLECVKVRVLIEGDECNLTSLLIEITSDVDVFMHYTCIINDNGFLRLREDQNLLCEYSQFLRTLLVLFNRCIAEHGRILCSIVFKSKDTASLDFIENLQYKMIPVLLLPLKASTPEVVREQVQYRYTAALARLNLVLEQMDHKILSRALSSKLIRPYVCLSTGPHQKDASIRTLLSLSRPLTASELLKTIRSDPGMTAVYYANRYFGSDKVMQVNHILWGQLKRYGKVYHERTDSSDASPQWFPVFGMARIHRVQRHNPEEEDLSVLNENTPHLGRSMPSDYSNSSDPSGVCCDTNKGTSEVGDNFSELETLIIQQVEKQPGKDIQYYIQFLPEKMQSIAPLVFRHLRKAGMIKREFTSGGTFVWR